MSKLFRRQLIQVISNESILCYIDWKAIHICICTLYFNFKTRCSRHVSTLGMILKWSLKLKSTIQTQILLQKPSKSKSIFLTLPKYILTSSGYIHTDNVSPKQIILIQIFGVTDGIGISISVLRKCVKELFYR